MTEKARKVVDNDLFEKNYIIKKELLSNTIDNRYLLKLNRAFSCLDVYEQENINTIFYSYPIRKDFDPSGYSMYTLKREMPCIFGNDGEMRTPTGLFRIKKTSPFEYVSSYHPKYKEVKFFGYLVIFEDYFIHSDIYFMDATDDDFRQKEPISKQDKYTSGCIRVAQNNLDWLIGNIPVGTMIEL